MFPLRDYTRNRRIRFPYVNVVLIAINVVVFIYEVSLGPDLNSLIAGWGVTPYEIFHGVDIPPLIPVPVFFTLITSMFLHANLLHIGGNVLFLWVFGDNVEDSMGHFRYLIFFLLTGVIAAFSQLVFDVNGTDPTIGASGAISGILGAYIVLFPRGKVTTLILLGIIPLIIRLPALVMLGYWIVIQVFFAVAGLGGSPAASSGGVAFFAHIGGFISGAVLIFLFRNQQQPRPYVPPGR